MLAPTYLSPTVKRTSTSWSYHLWTITKKVLTIPWPQVGTHSFEGISPLRPTLPGKPIKLLSSTSPKTPAPRLDSELQCRGWIWIHEDCKLGLSWGIVKVVPNEKIFRDLHEVSLELKEKHFHQPECYKRMLWKFHWTESWGKSRVLTGRAKVKGERTRFKLMVYGAMPWKTFEIEMWTLFSGCGGSKFDSNCKEAVKQEAWVQSLGLRRSSGKRNGNPLPYFYLENPMDRGAWRASLLGVAE